MIRSTARLHLPAALPTSKDVAVRALPAPENNRIRLLCATTGIALLWSAAIAAVCAGVAGAAPVTCATGVTPKSVTPKGVTPKGATAKKAPFNLKPRRKQPRCNRCR